MRFDLLFEIYCWLKIKVDGRGVQKNWKTK